MEWDPDAHPRQHDKTIIGYYASWQWYDRNGLAVDNQDIAHVGRLLTELNLDEQYPERAYIAPASVVQYTQATEGVQPVVGAQYKMKFKLPEGVFGNVVLLQWYYLTANSCKHEGYANYTFPEEWGNEVFDAGLPDCGDIPKDGNGVPEQVRNY